MSQPSVTAFFNTRKRAANDDINSTKSKVFLTESLDSTDECFLYNSNGGSSVVCPRFLNVDPCVNKSIINNNLQSNTSKSDNLLQYYAPLANAEHIQQQNDDQTIIQGIRTRSCKSTTKTGPTTVSTVSNIKSVITNDEEVSSAAEETKQKLVPFIKKGNLSPRKKFTPQQNLAQAFASKESISNSEKNEITSNKQIEVARTTTKEKLRNLVKKELSFDEVKTKVTRSAKLQELKASLGRLQELEKKRKTQEEKNNRLRNGEVVADAVNSGMTLKKFKTIELEVLTR